ncbi:hypothetical protein U3516DRAFT_566928, partial [Neocallimastix sp. 'constans']
KKEILKYRSFISIAKHKKRDEIKNNLIPLDIKPKHIFDEVSQRNGIHMPLNIMQLPSI